MDITRARRMIKALICEAERVGGPSQPRKPMGNGARGIGARQMVDGAMLNRLVSGGNRLLRRLQRHVPLNQAIVAPTTREVWAINRLMLAVVGVSAKRQPVKPNHAGKRPVGRQLSPRRLVHAAARVTRRQRRPSGTSQPRASLPGKPPGQPVSGGSLNRLLDLTPAAQSSQQAPEA